MTPEAVAALVLAGLWALAGAASVSRPRFRLGSYFVWTCWILASVAALGGALSAVLDVRWPATWLVAVASSLVVLVRTRTARRAASTASADGVAALVVVAIGLASAGGITASAALANVVLDWPERVGLVMLVALAAVAAVTTIVHVGAPTGGRHLAIWLVGGLGAGLVLSASAVSFVHLLVGDIDDGDVRASEAVFAGFVAVLVSLVVVPPLLLWIGRRVNEGRPDQHAMLSRVDDVVQRRLPLDETLLQVCELVRTGLQLDRVEAWSAGEIELGLVASDPYGATRRVPLGDNARRVAGGAAESATGDWVRTWLPGLLANAQAAPGDPGSDAPDTGVATSAVSFGGDFQGLVVAYGGPGKDSLDGVLDAIAHRLGPVMHSASLDASLTESVQALRAREKALRASRERLVVAADAERARIERDLHDGAQQHLVALSVNLQLARGLVRTNPQRAEEILAELANVARTAVEELRLLSHGIFPKTLEDEGIGPALDETAQRHEGIEVRVVASGSRRFSREVEVAVYFACNEAITNAIKHAKATSVGVNLVGSERELVFEIVDDGLGFDVDGVTSQNGLTNMADRIGAVDGQLTVSSGDDGTRVLGRVPLG